MDVRGNSILITGCLFCHVVLTFIFVGGEREPRFDLWSLLIKEAVLHLFIIQKTFLGSSLVMNMHEQDLQSHSLALNSRIVPYILGKLKYLKN